MSNDGIGSVDMLSNNDPKPKSILNNNNNINLVQQQPSKMPLQRSLTQPQGTIEYTVAENDTITSVAARFHTTPTELARINRRFGQFIFPGQILFVPKSNSTLMSLSADNMDSCGKQQHQQNHASRAPPNTPNDPLLSQSPTHGGGAAVQQQQQPSPLSNDRLKDSNQSPSSTSTTSSVDQLSPLPGHAQRIVDENPRSAPNNNPPFSAPPTAHPSPPSHLFDEKLKSFYHQQQPPHHPLNHTASEPVNVIPATPEIGAKKEITATAMVHHPQPHPPPTTTTAASTMDPADRDCLERFLKINVRYITDGQGVVSGVLLVTPNAMMFDSNVSDPLVMEHGPEMYNVTIPIDLVLKTALYSDIAHMRVKHAPEAVPAVPKPSVYYASDEDTVGGGIVDENLKNVYAQKKNAFDTIGKVSEEKPEDTESSPEPPGQQCCSGRAEMDQLGGGGGRQAKVVAVEKKPSTETMNDDDEFKDAVEHQTTTSNNNQPQQQEDAKTSTSATAATIIDNNNNQNCDEVHNNNDDNHSNHETDSDREQNHNNNNKWPKDSTTTTTKVISKPTNKNPDCGDQSQSLECDEDVEGDDEEEVSLSKFDETEDSQQQKRSAFKSVIESMDDDQATSIDQSLDLMTSMDDNDALQLLPTPPLSATLVVDHHNNNNKKHSPYMAKISLAERHSAPLQQANHRQNNSNTSGRGGGGSGGNDTTTNAGPRSNNCPANNEQEHKPLQSAVSAEETYSDPSPLRPHQRLSAAGENRRGQMLKRLSNPVDAIGNFTKSGISSGINATKSGFNATKTGFSKGLNATQSGINTGFQATKSGLTTGLSATKTGFTKVLSTPKNLMNLTTEFRRDAKGPLATAAPPPSGSKSDINLQEHYLDSSSGGSGGSFDETQQQHPQHQNPGRAESPVVGYCNMVDKKIDAFENFDKLIPRPARVNKDAPLYLCIRMGKYRKDDNRNRYQHQQPPRYSPTNSFGKKKYEREYWFSVPKEKARNLYHFFKKWAPEIYGDVDDIRGCEQRCLEPINTDDEYDLFDEDIGLVAGDNTSNGGNNSSGGGGGNANKNDGKQHHRSSYLRIFSQDKATVSGDNAGMLSGGPIDPTNQPADAANNNAKMTANANRQRFWRRSPLHFLKLVEDHFSTDGLSAEWNVSNSSEEHSFAERYHLETDSNEPILPEMIGTTELLTAEIIEKLSKHLPARAEGYAWTLIYSTSQHGFSLNTLYREMRHFDSPVLLIIEDTNGAKFGALLSHSLRISDHFYGTGETFLFTFHPTFECFPWTGENIFFIKGNFDSIAIGAGEGNFGLWLDGDLYHGSSHPCKTFGNRTLSSEEDFVVKSIECWGFV